MVRTFAEGNVATCFEFAQKFVHAKNVQGVMQLQAELVKTQLQAVLEQTTELADAAIKTVVGGYPSPRTNLPASRRTAFSDIHFSSPGSVSGFSVHGTFRHARERTSCLDRAQGGLSASLPPRACPARRRGSPGADVFIENRNSTTATSSIDPGQPRRW
jgi:hypothetical protein